MHRDVDGVDHFGLAGEEFDPAPPPDFPGPMSYHLNFTPGGDIGVDITTEFFGWRSRFSEKHRASIKERFDPVSHVVDFVSLIVGEGFPLLPGEATKGEPNFFSFQLF